jgi:RHS repeat-associated protein
MTFAAVSRRSPTTTKTTTGYTYDNNNNQKTITDQAGLITTKNYDDLNRLNSVVDALQQTTQYSHDLDNNLAGVTDANLHATVFGYDDLNRRNLRQLPLLMSESSVYDAAGNLASRTDFNGKTTTYSYDSLNRLLSKTPDSTLNEAAVSFTYTATGKRATMQDASGLTTYTYDNRDRLNTKATPQGTLSYTYDGANNVLSIASSNANGASLSYTYDADDRLSSAADNRLQAQGKPGVTTYSYDPAGNLTNYLYPNTVSTTYTFDTLNRVTGMKSTCFGASGCNILNNILANYGYTLGPAGNRTNVAESGVAAQSLRNVAYHYDNDYRLASEIISGDPAQNGTISYTYDPGGNQTQRNSTVPAIPATGTLTYDANDRSTTDPYDANGNLLNSGTGTNVWDFDNRLVQGGSVNIVYDGDGNRVSETVAGVTTKYLVDTQNPTGYAQVIDELVNGSVNRTYAYGLQRISQNQLIGGVWTPSFYGYDGHGSVRYLTNAASTVTDKYQYDAFGNLIASTGSTPNNYRFSGEPFDPALGMYQMRARWYRQATGRFVTRDPLEGRCCTPLSWNPYIYASDNPVNRIDPNGKEDSIEYEAITNEVAKLLRLHRIYMVEKCVDAAIVAINLLAQIDIFALEIPALAEILSTLYVHCSGVVYGGVN